VVGSDHQQHLHVVFHPALRGRGRALAVQPDRLGGIRPSVRCAVVRFGRRLRGPAGGPTVGGRALHSGRHRQRPVEPAVHVPKRCRCSRRRTAGRDADESAGCSPIRGADFHTRLGDPASAVGRRAGQLGTGQRKSGRGDSLAARRVDRDDFDLPVAAGQAQLASATGGVPVGDGLRAGVLGRAFRRRHLGGLGARRSGVSTPRPRRLVVVAAQCYEVSCRRPGSANERSWSQTPRRRPGRPARRRNRCAAWRARCPAIAAGAR
jgi:hypothetical protein